MDYSMPDTLLPPGYTGRLDLPYTPHRPGTCRARHRANPSSCRTVS